MSARCQDETAWTDEPLEGRSPLLPVRQWYPGGPGRPPGERRRVLTGIVSVKKTAGRGVGGPKTLGLGRASMGTADAGAERACGSG
jgi:hypothetical protein